MLVFKKGEDSSKFFFFNMFPLFRCVPLDSVDSYIFLANNLRLLFFCLDYSLHYEIFRILQTIGTNIWREWPNRSSFFSPDRDVKLSKLNWLLHIYINILFFQLLFVEYFVKRWSSNGRLVNGQPQTFSCCSLIRILWIQLKLQNKMKNISLARCQVSKIVS